MAHHREKRGLDKSARAALNGLDAILATLVDDSLKPGEFTAWQAYEKHRDAGGTKTYDSIRYSLREKFKRGELLRRPVVINGKAGNAYRPA